MVKVKVPSAADAAGKWADVTPGRAGYYEKAATVAGADWEAGATAGAKAFKAGVSVADIDKRFSGGVKKAGASKYNRKVKDVGVGRFGPGVAAAKSDMETGVAPYLAEIATVELPDRGTRGDPTNYTRVEKIGSALHKKRLAALAAGS